MSEPIAKLTFHADVPRARIQRLQREAGGTVRLMEALGARGVKVLRHHFLEKDKQGNRKGWRRSHFWNRRIRAATALGAVTEKRAEINIAAPEMAQKIFGGTLTAKESKNLAIPAREEAAGVSPRMFDDLQFIPVRRGDLAGLLVQREPGFVPFGPQRPAGTTRITGSKPSAQGLVFYFLMAKVTQDADPTAMPEQGLLASEITEEAADYYDRQIAQ